MAEKNKVMNEDEVVEIKQADITAISNELEELRNKVDGNTESIEGRWIQATSRKNGLILNKYGMTEILFLNDAIALLYDGNKDHFLKKVESIIDERSPQDFAKTVIYEQNGEGEDNSEIEKEEKEDN